MVRHFLLGFSEEKRDLSSFIFFFFYMNLSLVHVRMVQSAKKIVFLVLYFQKP